MARISLLLIAAACTATGLGTQDKYASSPEETPGQRRARFTQTAPRLARLEEQFDRGTFTVDGGAIPYRLFRPRDYDSGASYPLVVFFHGGGGRGSDNQRHIADAHYSARVWALPEFQSEHPCFILAPQLLSGTARSDWKVVGELVRRASDADPEDEISGVWRLTVSAEAGRSREMRMVLERQGDAWTGMLSMPGRPANSWVLNQIVYADRVLSFYFGSPEPERNNKMELHIDGAKLRGTLARNLQGDETARWLIALIDHVCMADPVDKSRIYVTGLSMGGGVSWDMIARYPDRFAAAVPVCGKADPAAADRIVQHGVAVWAFHGADDPVISPDASRAMVNALRRAGGEPRYTEYPGVQHDSWIDAYQESGLHDWLFGQRRTE